MQTDTLISTQIGKRIMRKYSIKNLWIVLVASVILILPTLVGTSANAIAKNYLKISKAAIGSTQTVNIGLNKSMVIDLPGKAHDILVANPDVADAITRTSSRIYVFAKQVGSTNIFIFDSQGNQLLSIDLVIERDIAGLEAHLKKYIPGSNVSVEMLNDNVILTGTVPTPQSAAKAVQLAQVFVTGGEATTNQFQPSLPTTTGENSDIFLSSEERRTSQIVNLLQIDGEDQVHLKVTVAEIQRTIVKQLGINLDASGITAGAVDLSMLGSNPTFLTGAASFGNWGTNGQRTGFNYSGSGGESIRGLVNALDRAGVMRTLAEPSLTAISGETAQFSAGGKYSIPQGKSEGQDGIELEFEEVEYGVSLSFSPVVLSPGRISLRIRTEVSEPSTNGLAYIPRGTVAGVPFLGVRRRQAETTVELPSGGSMVLAGLLQDDVRQVSAGFPGLRKVPILGTLFRSREFQRSETELVIIATPYLVRPVARQKLARPDDNFMPAADGASNFLGRINRVYGKVDGEMPEGRFHGKIGFIFK